MYKSTLHRVVHRGANYRYVLVSRNDRFVVLTLLLDSQRLVRAQLTTCGAALTLFQDSVLLRAEFHGARRAITSCDADHGGKGRRTTGGS